MEILELIKNLLLPSNFAFIFFWAGVILLLFKRKKSLSLFFMIIGGSILTLFSSGVVVSSLLTPLEYSYPIVELQQNEEEQYIIFLAGYAADDENMPLSSRMNSHSAFRMLEVMHIYRRCKICKIIISGTDQAVTIYRDLFIELGLPEIDIGLDQHARHTESSAANLKKTLGNKPFYLVTSAGHMPRAMGVFRKLGLNPVSAPTDFSMPKNPWTAPIGLSSQHLYFSDLAINEIMGLIWYKFTGRI